MIDEYAFTASAEPLELLIKEYYPYDDNWGVNDTPDYYYFSCQTEGALLSTYYLELYFDPTYYILESTSCDATGFPDQDASSCAINTSTGYVTITGFITTNKNAGYDFDFELTNIRNPNIRGLAINTAWISIMDASGNELERGYLTVSSTKV